MAENIQFVIDNLLEKYSESEIKKALSRSKKKAGEKSLTVVVNFGMHSLPEDILRGDVLFFSEGNLDLSPEGISDTFEGLSKRAVRFLRGKIWQNIYIIPSGHPALVVLATMVTYRVTRVDPTVVYYIDGHYNDIKLNIRSETQKNNSLI